MVDICKFADDINSILMLSPTMDLGATSINRLKKFYKRFGFVENSGKRKMYELPLLKMYRLPRNMKDA
jgi:predicted GNAT family N-acyltransferase